MSQENVELVRGLQPGPDVDVVAMFSDAAAGQLLEALAPVFDPAFECALVLPGARKREHSGLPGLRAAWLEWLEPWGSYRVEIEDVVDAGDAAVVLTRDFGRRPGMEAEVALSAAAVWTVRDGKVVRAEFCSDREAALEAAGLSE